MRLAIALSVLYFSTIFGSVANAEDIFDRGLNTGSVGAETTNRDEAKSDSPVGPRQVASKQGEAAQIDVKANLIYNDGSKGFEDNFSRLQLLFDSRSEDVMDCRVRVAVQFLGPELNMRGGEDVESLRSHETHYLGGVITQIPSNIWSLLTDKVTLPNDSEFIKKFGSPHSVRVIQVSCAKSGSGKKL